VVLPGAEPPAAWADALRIVVGPEALQAPVPVVEALHDAWAQRRPVVIELGVDPEDLRSPERYVGPVHALTPGFTFWRERLQFLVWANTYDARDGDPVWWHGRKVARRLAAEGVAEAVPADVSRPDGAKALQIQRARLLRVRTCGPSGPSTSAARARISSAARVL
jgi:DNA helicase-2/ATP-dependent DNA helicase PcrA